MRHQVISIGNECKYSSTKANFAEISLLFVLHMKIPLGGTGVDFVTRLCTMIGPGQNLYIQVGLCSSVECSYKPHNTFHFIENLK